MLNVKIEGELAEGIEAEAKHDRVQNRAARTRDLNNDESISAAARRSPPRACGAVIVPQAFAL